MTFLENIYFLEFNSFETKNNTLYFTNIFLKKTIFYCKYI